MVHSVHVPHVLSFFIIYCGQVGVKCSAKVDYVVFRKPSSGQQKLSCHEQCVSYPTKGRKLIFFR